MKGRQGPASQETCRRSTVNHASGGRRMGDVMSLRLPCRAALSVIPLFLMTASASAHHVMGGKMPTTFAEGFLSGLGHPVIGPDHLAFLLAIGVAVGVGGLILLVWESCLITSLTHSLMPT